MCLPSFGARARLEGGAGIPAAFTISSAVSISGSLQRTKLGAAWVSRGPCFLQRLVSRSRRHRTEAKESMPSQTHRQRSSWRRTPRASDLANNGASDFIVCLELGPDERHAPSESMKSRSSRPGPSGASQPVGTSVRSLPKGLRSFRRSKDQSLEIWFGSESALLKRSSSRRSGRLPGA